MMIRKFFASLLFLLFLLTLIPLLVVQSFFSAFLNEGRLTKKVIPESFDTVVSLYAEQFSQKPEEIKLVQERLSVALDRDTYSAVVGEFAQTFLKSLAVFDKEQQFVVDMKPLKVRLSSALPSILNKLPFCPPNENKMDGFRFCKPTVFAKGKDFGQMVTSDIVKEQIPNQFVFFNKQQAPSAGSPLQSSGQAEQAPVKAFGFFLLAKQYLPILLIAAFLLFVVLLAALVFPPWTAVIKWIGASWISLAVLLGLLVVSSLKLTELPSFTHGLSPAMVDFIAFLIRQPMSLLGFWAFFIGAAGIFLFGSGLILARKK